jgi:hypothetical protein
MYSALGITSRLPRTSRRDDELAGTSKFSYSSEILEKHWEPKASGLRERLGEGSYRLPAQNLTEIPPRTERPVGQTSRIVSLLLVLDWKSSRLRASMTA